MPSFLTKEKFLESLQLAPRLVVEIVCTNSNGSILLVPREHEPFEGMWHLPGSFLLKGETLSDCYERIFETEIGTKEIPKFRYIDLRENISGDPRGHLLHYIVTTTIKNPTKVLSGQWFSEIPENTIPFQKDFIKAALEQ